jgi:hypothetical protein
MNRLRPTPIEERWLLVAARYKPLQLAASTARSGGWRSASVMSRALLFVLGLFAAGIVGSIFNLLQLPAWMLLAGITLIGVGEWLVVRKRLFASGIEEALIVMGLMLIVLQLSDWVGGSHDVMIAALIAAAFMLGGWRLLNPLFTTLAVTVFSYAVARSMGDAWRDPSTTVASGFCLCIAFVALVAGRVEYERPAHDRMLDWLVIAMPVVAYGWAVIAQPSSFRIESLWHPTLANLLPVIAPLAFGVVAAVIGVRRKTHAPLIAALLCVLCLAVELRAVTGLALHWRLIMWGSAALLIAIAVERHLRSPRNGITSREVGENLAGADLLQMAGAATLAPATTTATAPATGNQVSGGGGEFGGGGASGKF